MQNNFGTTYTPQYPADFTRVNGVDIDERTIQRWIEELSNEEYGFVKSGSVIVVKVGSKYVVAKGYEEYDVILDEEQGSW